MEDAEYDAIRAAPTQGLRACPSSAARPHCTRVASGRPTKPLDANPRPSTPSPGGLLRDDVWPSQDNNGLRPHGMCGAVQGMLSCEGDVKALDSVGGSGARMATILGCGKAGLGGGPLDI